MFKTLWNHSGIKNIVNPCAFIKTFTLGPIRVQVRLKSLCPSVSIKTKYKKADILLYHYSPINQKSLCCVWRLCRHQRRSKTLSSRKHEECVRFREFNPTKEVQWKFDAIIHIHVFGMIVTKTRCVNEEVRPRWQVKERHSLESRRYSVDRWRQRYVVGDKEADTRTDRSSDWP